MMVPARSSTAASVVSGDGDRLGSTSSAGSLTPTCLQVHGWFGAKFGPYALSQPSVAADRQWESPTSEGGIPSPGPGLRRGGVHAVSGIEQPSHLGLHRGRPRSAICAAGRAADDLRHRGSAAANSVHGGREAMTSTIGASGSATAHAAHWCMRKPSGRCACRRRAAGAR